MTRKITALLAILTLFAGCAAISSGSAQAQTDQVLRVLMTNLKLTNQASISLDGSYTIGGMAFNRGSDVVISCASGELILYYEGMSVSLGKSVSLERHEVPDDLENGLRVNGASALYCGDLRLSVQNSALRAILHIPLEEYLLGVVPYEMSDSFPLEALKAQAVAARTYALRKAGASGDYDVVDNTNDQVYKGYSAANTRAAQAVSDTRGLCGYYKGALAECFYSASNGGQTELVANVWGKGDYAYLDMRDDPYDLENPDSAVRSFTIPKDTKNGVIANAELTSLLLTALSEPMEALGFDGDIQNINIAGVIKVEAASPKYASPSRLYTRLRFTLSVEGRKWALPSPDGEEDVSFLVKETEATPAPTDAPKLSDFIKAEGEITVELDYFDDLESLMKLSINGGDNELISVDESESAFTVRARRFGHGVGMSQRGAQQMAKEYHMTYEDILKFYYPGMTLILVPGAVTPRPALSADFLYTPGPTPSPTPRPTLMPLSTIGADVLYTVTVSNIEANSYLNLRLSPGLDGEVVRVLYYGQRLAVLEEVDEKWLRVRTDDAQGYVMAEFVKKEN